MNDYDWYLVVRDGVTIGRIGEWIRLRSFASERNARRYLSDHALTLDPTVAVVGANGQKPGVNIPKGSVSEPLF